MSRGAVEGAEITSRSELPARAKPARSAAAAFPPTAARPVTPPTLRRTPPRFDWHAEINRRIDLVESQGLLADVEEIVTNLQAELGHPSIDRTAARLASQRRLG